MIGLEASCVSFSFPCVSMRSPAIRLIDRVTSGPTTAAAFFTKSGEAMKFACLVYHEHRDTISEAELSAIVAECRDAAAWNEGIKKAGHHVFTSGLQGPATARTVRKREGKLSITDGPFAETKECLGGFTIIEARDMSEALELVSKFPARLTSVEIRPVMDPNAELTDPGDRRVMSAIARQSNS
jgi:hypothetical protein